jgi:hypothetical protein
MTTNNRRFPEWEKQQGMFPHNGKDLRKYEAIQWAL